MYLDDAQKLAYGIVECLNPTAATIILHPIIIEQYGQYHGCPVMPALTAATSITISTSKYRGHFDVVDGFINTYIVLNIIKQ
jgi:hypothetical protein